MDQAGFEDAAAYWDRKDAGRDASKVMPEGELREVVDEFLAGHDTCALATATLDGRVRNTPLEYAWADGAVWIFSEGGRKFAGLAENPNVCVAVFEPYAGFGKLAGAQVTGVAEVVDPGSPEFLAAAVRKGIPEARVGKLAQMLHLIKVVPTRIDVLLSELKDQGYDSRQVLVLGD